MRKRILVVDDEAEFTTMLRHTLEAEGYYHVCTENDPNRAVQSAREFDPDLIVLDVMMPDLDGSDVAARLREDRRFSQTPIIYMTALAMGAGSAFGDRRQNTTQTYIPKTISTEELIDCIEDKLSQAVVGAGGR
jgi:CheY-like chemotaxis protein